MGSYAVGMIFGPVIGGILYDGFGYAAPFILSAVVAFLALIAALVMIPETRTPEIRQREILRTRHANPQPERQTSIWDALPLTASANRWGDEIYFSIPLQLERADDAREVVSLGALGFWPPGHAFCVFFGPTPMSSGDEIRAASPVNVFGRIIGEADVFKQVLSGHRVSVTRASQT